jgi:hypothetical protein
MPSSDDFVRDALQQRTVDVPTEGVFERVARKRTRLVWQRRLIGAAAVVAVVGSPRAPRPRCATRVTRS